MMMMIEHANTLASTFQLVNRFLFRVACMQTFMSTFNLIAGTK